MRFTLETIIPNDLKQNVAMVGAEKTDKDRGLTWKLVAQRVENYEVELYIKCTSIQKFSPFSCEVELHFGNDSTRIAHFDNCKTKCDFIHLPMQNLQKESEFGKLLSVVVDLKHFERDGKTLEVETISKELAQPAKRSLDDICSFSAGKKKKRVEHQEPRIEHYCVDGITIPVRMESLEDLDARFNEMLAQLAEAQKMAGNEQSGSEFSVYIKEDQISLRSICAQVQQGLAPHLGAPKSAEKKARFDPTEQLINQLNASTKKYDMARLNAQSQQTPKNPEMTKDQKLRLSEIFAQIQQHLIPNREASQSPGSESGDFEYIPTEEEMKEKIAKLESENKKLQERYDGLNLLVAEDLKNQQEGDMLALKQAREEIRTMKKTVDKLEEANLSLKFKLRNLEQNREETEYRRRS